MFKKIVSACLSLVVVLGLSCQILAHSADTGLSHAILYVKNVFDISDDYIDLNISSSDYGSYKKWNLTWHGLKTDINVCVTGNDTILSYNKRSTTPENKYSFNFSPILSKEKFIACKQQAINFLNKVLRENESFYFYNMPNTFSTNSYNPIFTGVIKLNGIDSVFDFSITVNLSDTEVISFLRDEFIGLNNDPIPNNSPNINSSNAKSIFINELPVTNIEYILDPNNPSDTVAKLVYTLPDYSRHYVNADSGRLFYYNNYYPLNRDTVVDSPKLKTDVDNSLSEIELDAINKISDVLPSTELDKLVKSQKELGITKYKLSSYTYAKTSTSKDIFCRLVYTSDNDFESLGMLNNDNALDTTISKFVLVNAKTGTIISLYTSYPYRKSEPYHPIGATTDYHIDFLKRSKNSFFEKSKLFSFNDNNFKYVQIVNNYLFKQNYLTLRVNKYTGYVDSFSEHWDDSITFEQPNKIISSADATKILQNNSTAKLYYITEILEDKKETLLLAYLLQYPKIDGILAKDGSFLAFNAPSSKPFTYLNIDTCYAKDRLILLGEHGVGFDHSKIFYESKELTQLDALILFANTLGYSFDSRNITIDNFKSIYNIAYAYNIITPLEKEPLKPISRCQFLKMLLSSSYSYLDNLKNLRNILKCNFIDCNTISDEYFPYICIANGFGLIVGNGDSHFRPNDTITRLDACNILYNFMNFNTSKI
ncbi:MAG: S-layer homology domain-containing protein [Clostridiales bacterium]|nr:S-layer homology domain-containing protein [Clostridiales bacterium]